MLTLPEEASLPAVWLPAGQELRVRVTRDGKPEADARVEGYLSRWGAGDSGYGFWCPYLPGQRTDATGEVRWWVQGSGRFGASAVAKDGRWGRESRTLPVNGPVELRLASRKLAVKVQDEKGEPVAGIEVATGSAPAGTAVGDRGGRLGDAAGLERAEGDVVAWSETRAGRMLVRPDTRGPVVVKAEPRGLPGRDRRRTAARAAGAGLDPGRDLAGSPVLGVGRSREGPVAGWRRRPAGVGSRVDGRCGGCADASIPRQTLT